MDPVRRKILKAGAAATAMAAAPGVLGQQTGKGSAAVSFYEKGPVRIHYDVFGSGFPLLLIAGGGLNSTISGLKNPFDARSSSPSTVASRLICATRIRASLPDRSRSNDRGIHTPTTSLASSITWASTNSW